jgi:hypothetical protein
VVPVNRRKATLNELVSEKPSRIPTSVTVKRTEPRDSGELVERDGLGQMHADVVFDRLLLPRGKPAADRGHFRGEAGVQPDQLVRQDDAQ